MGGGTARLAAWLLRHRLLSLLVVVAGTLALALPLGELKVGWSIAAFTRSERPELRAAGEHYDEFPVPDNLLLFGYPEPEPFGAPAQRRLAELERALRELPGVQQVVTLASAPGVAGPLDGLRARLAESSTWRGVLVGRHEDALGGIVALEHGLRTDRLEAFFAGVAALPDAPALRFSGVPFHRHEVTHLVAADQRLYLPLAAGITSLLLLLLVPQVTLALIALLVVPFTLVATFGAMALAGVGITMLTSVLPTLLMAMAVADGVHMVQRFLEERRAGHEPRVAAERTLAALLWPCLLTSLTTITGFLSLTLTDNPDLRDLGLFAALGMAAAYLYTVVVVPAALASVHALPRRRPLPLVAWTTAAATRLVLGPRWRVLVPTAALLLLAGAGILRLEQDSRLHDDLWQDSRVVQDIAWYERNFIGMMPGEVLVEAKGTLDEPQARAEFARLVAWLEQQPGVDRTLSWQDLAQDGGILAFGPVAQLAGLLSADRQRARVLMFRQDVGLREVLAFAEQVRAHAEQLRHIEARPVGVQWIASRLVDELTTDLGRSFAGTFATILILTMLWFRSIRAAIVAVVPNLLPLVLTLGLMGWSGIPLRPLTAITFCVTFGLAVDDTIHLLARWREERRAGRPRAAALTTMLEAAGRPVVITTLLLLTGFGTILTGSFRGTFQFGLLTGTALLAAMAGAMLLLPIGLRGRGTRT